MRNGSSEKKKSTRLRAQPGNYDNHGAERSRWFAPAAAVGARRPLGSAGARQMEVQVAPAAAVGARRPLCSAGARQMEVQVGAHTQQHDTERVEENQHSEFGIQVALPVPPYLETRRDRR